MWQVEEEVLELARLHASTLEKVTISGYASSKIYDFVLSSRESFLLIFNS